MAKATKARRFSSKRALCLATGLVFALLATAAMHAQSVSTAAPMTVTTETGNNTSAPDTFATSTNGNITPGNVSKLPLRDLIFPNAPTKIYAHYVGWFGGRDHIDIGYDSSDAAQVQKQVADMITRGIDGVIIDWYGPADTNRFATARNTEAATQTIMAEAEKASGFEFAIMVDKGALSHCHKDCDATAELIRQMTYVQDTYQKSPAYMRVNGRPVVLFFGVDRNYQIDWQRVAKRVPGDPILVFQDARGFGDRLSNSGYAWVKIDKEDRRNWMDNYLHYFYGAGKSGDSRGGNDHHGDARLASDVNTVFGAVYKGFDDSMASWSEQRVMAQDCGRTWLRTWAKIAEEYTPDDPLHAVQLVTWNDYEEGTEIETGIDNCVAIKAGRSGGSLKWSVDWSSAKQADIAKNGPEDDSKDSKRGDNRGDNKPEDRSTPELGVDHYAVYVSSDGNNLTQVAELPVGSREFNFSSLSLPAGRYYLYVQAVGRPGLLNHTAGPVTVDIARQQ